LPVAAIVLLGIVGGYGPGIPTKAGRGDRARALRGDDLARGWLPPSHNFEPHYDKPILYYRLTSPRTAGSGANEAGARLVSAMAALATLVAVFRWTAVVAASHRPARGPLLATSPGFVSLGATAASTCCSRAGSRSAVSPPSGSSPISTRTAWLVGAVVAARSAC
jgi:hypothetical protein